MKAAIRGFRLSSLLVLVVACNRGPVLFDTAGTPPSSPTHHVRIEGTVVSLSGTGLESIGVGARYAASSAPERRVSVIGGSYTDASGAYLFEVKASAPRTRDGTADVYIHATQYGSPGQTVVHDSVLMAVQLVPLDQLPTVTRAPRIRLPI